MGDLDLFTESKNLERLLRYDVSKLVPTRAILGFCMGKTPEKMTFRNFRNDFPRHQQVKKSRFLFFREDIMNI